MKRNKLLLLCKPNASLINANVSLSLEAFHCCLTRACGWQLVQSVLVSLLVEKHLETNIQIGLSPRWKDHALRWIDSPGAEPIKGFDGVAWPKRTPARACRAHQASQINLIELACPVAATPRASRGFMLRMQYLRRAAVHALH